MCAYFLKAEDDILETFISQKSTFKKIKHITRASMTKRESFLPGDSRTMVLKKHLKSLLR